MKDVKNIGAAELRHIVWKQIGVRADPATGTKQLHEFLQYKIDEIPSSCIDDMRKELIDFIKVNKNKLSLPCDGDCHQHTDGVVLSCYKTYQEDGNGISQ